MKWLYAFLIATLIILGAKAENDTATSTNILPNAGTTSSNMDNFNLDGVNSGTGNLSNNSTHNGFTITCGTVVEGNCGKAFNGELESSRDMKVGASGTLIDVDGVEAGTTYTSTQNKLDGGIHLNSYFSVQNCEDGNSSFSCGQSSGADDSYNLHVKIKDADGNTLAEMTTTRLNDAGYNSNSAKFNDNLVWNGTGAASYEWYWQGFDGQQSTSALRGPNLLGAELLLDFPIDDHEPLTLEERTVINEALNTVDLTENEIYDIISGLESMIEEEFFASGNLEEGARVELSIEESGLTFEIASKETGAIVMEAPIAQEMFAPIMEAMPIETLKEEMVAMVQEEMPFMEIIEELSPPAAMEEEAPKEEEPKAMAAGPMLTAPPQEKEETNSKEPATMEVASAPKKETPQTSKKETSVVKEKNEREEKKEPEEKESNSEASATSVVSKQDNTKQKKVQSKETVKPKLEKVMAKVDEKIKNPLKNLQLKNLIKMDAMVDNQLSLDSYNVAFYVPKNIYLDQLNLIDNRLIYSDKTLATYTNNDIIGIKARKLGIINNKKQQLLMELELLKKGDKMARRVTGQTKKYSLPDQVKVNTPEKEKKFKQKKYREKVEAMGGKVKYAEEFKKEKFKSKSKDVADLSGKRKDKYKVLSKTRVVTPSGTKKPVRKLPIIGTSKTSSRQDDGTIKTTQFSAKAYDQDRSTEPTKFKDIDSRVYGLKGGGKVKLALRGGGRAYGKNS